MIEVARDLVENYRFRKEDLERSLDHLIRRQVLGEPAFKEVQALLVQADLLSEHFKPSVEPRTVEEEINGRVYRLAGAHDAWVPEGIDYLRDNR